MSLAIKVVYQDGDEEFLCDGLGDQPTRFYSRSAAEKMRDFMLIGMEDEVQSINIVPSPKMAWEARQNALAKNGGS